MMKKMIALLSALLIVLSLFAGCGSTTDEPAADDTFVFTVGFDQEFPPYGYIGEDGEFTGFDLECAKVLADRLGWQIELQPIDWNQKDFELESGAIDCIWNGFTMTGREDQYTWTEPYVDNSQVVLVKADSGIASLADLAGKTVVVQSDSSALAALNEEDNADLLASFGELLEIGDYNTAFMDLEQGTVDAIAMDIGVAQFQIEGREDEFVILSETISTEQYAIGFLLGNTELRDQVQAEFSAMMADGTVQKIADEFGVTVIQK